MHDWLQRVWYGGAPAPWWLRALARLYGAAVGLRQACYARGWCRVVRVGRPVVVVGNLTVGGTGKTPLVIWLAGELSALGLQVAVITRGYGRTARARVAQGHHQHNVLRVDELCSAADVGDEALLIWRRAPVPVYVSRDRVAAARAAIAEGAQLLIADDGLQHLRLGRDMEIALIDAARGLGNGALLPAGPLREPAARLGSVAAVVLTGAGDYQHAGAARMHLSGDELLPLDGRGDAEALSAWRGRRVHAYAGIGNPERFFATLRAAGLELIAHPLPDHQAIARAALRPSDGLPVLMTEKDAVKCSTAAPGNCWYLPVTAQIDAAAANLLLRRILMDARLLDILACPVCKGPLRLAQDPGGTLLVCRADRLGFPVRDGIPVMLEEEARVLEAGDPLLER
jgi:tetraacyldisaccharide 4'-kinase